MIQDTSSSAPRSKVLTQDDKTDNQSAVEIIAVGNELLIGTTLDTNSHWISKRLKSAGFLVSRKTTIRDDVHVISQTFKEALSRNPRWVFSLGGLGPTYDDKTLEGLARAANRKLKLNETAANMLREMYKTRALQLGQPMKRITKYSLKMAKLPEGAEPLANREGSAPGVLLELRKSKIVSLPGVPREMKAIFADEVLPLLKKDSSRFKNSEEWFNVVGVGESQLAPLLLKLSKMSSPLLYVKSHPIGFKQGKSVLNIQIIGSAPASHYGALKEGMKKVSSYFSNFVANAGGTMKRTKSV